MLTALSPNRLLLRARMKKLLYIILLNKAAAEKKKLQILNEFLRLVSSDTMTADQFSALILLTTEEDQQTSN